MRLLLLLLTLMLWPAAGWSVAPACDVPTYDNRYCRFQVQGWTVEINERLVRESPQVAATVLEILHDQFAAIIERFPAVRVAELRHILVWIEPATTVGQQGGVYYPTSTDVPEEERFPAAKRGGIEFHNARVFIETRKAQPWKVAHELAHAFHELVLRFSNKEIKAAYDNAVQTGLYKQVKHVNGSTARAYALTNEQEYFAELTEAYFGQNDYFPFSRAELQSYDPIGFEAVRAAWLDTPPVVLHGNRGIERACEPASLSASPRSLQFARMIIRNGYAEPINLVWIDFNSEQIVRQIIGPGSLTLHYAYAGYNFLFLDEQGSCRAMATPRDAVSWIEVAP